jgi:hypothetical protein
MAEDPSAIPNSQLMFQQVEKRRRDLFTYRLTLRVLFTGKLDLWQARDELRQKSSKIVSLGAPLTLFPSVS